jgi:hypothetical protein
MNSAQTGKAGFTGFTFNAIIDFIVFFRKRQFTIPALGKKKITKEAAKKYGGFLCPAHSAPAFTGQSHVLRCTPRGRGRAGGLNTAPDT